MGQGASAPQQQQQQQQQQDDRGNGQSSPQRESENDNGARNSERASPFSTLRRSRRLRNSITQLSGRLMRSGSSTPIAHPATTSSPTSQSSRIHNPRIRRVGFLPSRTPPPLSSSASTPRHTGRSSSTPISLPPPLSPRLPSEFDSDSDTFMSDPTEVLSAPQSPDPDTSSILGHPPSVHRRSRLSRVRSSISTTLPNLLAELGSPRQSMNASRRNSSIFRPLSQFDDHEFDNDMDLDGPSNTSRASEPTSRTTHPDFTSLGDPSAIDLLENPRVRPGEDQAAMLSRLLSVAAAMTAASLVGSSEQALTEAQDVAGGDSVDGSFESFLRALQNGRLAAALRNGGNEMGGGVPMETGDGNLAPLNFFRMFRFGAGSGRDVNANSDSAEFPSTRMVPVIIVGIRSVTPRDNPPSETGAGAGPGSPFIDQIANLSANATGRFRTAANRRASMSAVGGDLNRSRRQRPQSELFPTAQSTADTPQGPHPPPSTPADLGLPSFSNGMLNPLSTLDGASSTSRSRSTSRVERRHSIAQERPTAVPEAGSASGESRAGPSQGTTNPGSGNSNTGQRRQGGEGTRSWIIYVLGGSYPENHPILTTPSLFTDSPTYEDMMLLSSLLGPAKPPVASREDIDSAGGLFTVSDVLPTAPTDKQFRKLPEGDRCLVCLSEYESGEECRSLTQCNHVFHRECIDTWLTTGRNSCPLCRSQGVQEKGSQEQSSPTPATPVDTVT